MRSLYHFRKSEFAVKTAAFIMAVILCISSFGILQVKAEEGTSESEKALEALADYAGTDIKGLIRDDSLILPGDSVSDWLAFDYGRLGDGSYAESYLKELEEYVTEKYAEIGGLDRIEATPWHRAILAITALGGDPTAFGKDADGNSVNLVKDGIYDFSAAESFDMQGLNAWLYALIALDCLDYEVPEGAKYTRQTIISHLVSSQEEDGGFGLASGSSDIDITAMVLQALAPYKDAEDIYETEDGSVTVSECIDKALDFLSSQQSENGTFVSCGAENSESCAQVVMALCCLGIDPETDERFIKSGNSAEDALLSFKNESGMYAHTVGDVDDVMATEQAIRALNAAERLRAGENSLYDLSDREVITGSADSGINIFIIIIPVAAAVVLVLIIWMLKKKGKHHDADEC